MINEQLIAQLFELITNQDIKAINGILDTVNDEIEYKKLDVAKNPIAQTLLHAALDTGNIAIFTALLAMDLNLNEVNSENKTVLEVAEIRNLKIISALITTRREWQGAITTFRFNRVVDLIHQAYPHIEPAAGENKLLLFGSTGAGKSTLLNYLNGTNYEISMNVSGQSYAVRLPGQKGGAEEIAKVGNRIYQSETLYAQIVKKAGLKYAYCDLAGLFDTRGPEKQICAASTIDLLAKLPGDIHGIVVLFDIPGFNTLKGAAFKKTALALAAITQMNEKLMDSVSFIITKAPLNTHITPDDIIEEYIDPLLLSMDDNLTQEELELHFVLTAMKKRKTQIIIPDITDQGKDRKKIENQLNCLTAQPAKAYNFLSHDNAQQCFNKIMLNMAQGFLKRVEQIENIIPNKIQEIKKLQEAEKENILNWQTEISTIEQELTGTFDASRLQAEMETKEKSILALNKQIKTLRETLVTHLEKKANLNIKLKGLDNDDMIELVNRKGEFSGRPTLYTMQHISPYPLDRIHTSYSGAGSLSYQQIKPQMTSERQVDPRDKQEVSIYYNNDDAKKGIYHGDFRASDGLSSVSVMFYAKRCDMHIAEIKNLRNEIKQLKDENKEIKSIRIPRLENEIERLQESIKSDAMAITLGNAQLAVRMENLKTRKSTLQNLIADSERRMAGHTEEEHHLIMSSDKNKLELDVNKALFKTAYKIITTLGLDDTDFGSFKQKFQKYFNLTSNSLRLFTSRRSTHDPKASSTQNEKRGFYAT